MESYQHFLISAVASPVLALIFLAGEPLGPILFWSVLAVLLGTFIDLDHFVLARLNTGSWERLFFALNNPLDAFSDGKKTMQNSMNSRQRYLSHVVLTLTATAVAYSVSDLGPAALVLTVMGLHIGCDLSMSFKKFLEG